MVNSMEVKMEICVVLEGNDCKESIVLNSGPYSQPVLHHLLVQ